VVSEETNPSDPQTRQAHNLVVIILTLKFVIELQSNMITYHVLSQLID